MNMTSKLISKIILLDVFPLSEMSFSTLYYCFFHFHYESYLIKAKYDDLL